MKVHLAVLLASTMLLVTFVADAPGHSYNDDNKVTIEYNAPAFSGRVKNAPHRLCRSHRKVILHRSSDGEQVGKDFTNRRGRWAIERPEAEGFYYASIDGIREGTLPHRHFCKADFSDSIQVP